MSDRTGLAAKVPMLELCRQMAEIPALAKAFGNSVVFWNPVATRYGGPMTSQPREYRLRCEVEIRLKGAIPAPLPCEMLAWLKGKAVMLRDQTVAGRTGWDVRVLRAKGCPSFDILDPDQVAQACIAASPRCLTCSPPRAAAVLEGGE